MKHILKQAVLLLIVLATVFCYFLPVSAASAQTKSLLDYEESSRTIELMSPVQPYAIRLDLGSKVTSLKSSKKSVAKVSAETYDNIPYLVVTPVKKGKTTVSFRYTFNGKTKKYKFRFKVVPYENPLKHLKIDGKGYAGKFSRKNYYAVSSKLKGKLKITPSKGWVVRDISVVKEQNGVYIRYKTLKSGKKVTLKKGMALLVTCFNGKRYSTVMLDYPSEKVETPKTTAAAAK